MVSFQKRSTLYSVSLVAVANRAAMACRSEPTVSGEMLSLYNLLTLGKESKHPLRSLNRRFLGLDAERGDQRCQLLDVNHNQNSFAILLRKATLIGRCGKRQEKSHQDHPFLR